jgi:vancomycin resistance protein YoaR
LSSSFPPPPPSPPASSPPPRPLNPRAGGRRRSRIRWVPVSILTLATLVVIAYAVGVLMTRGKIPHGTSIGGVKVGGKTVAQAKALLRSDLAPKATAGIPVTADGVNATIDPVTAGMTLDIDRSVDRLGTTSMSPSSILHGFGRGTAHDAVLKVDQAALTKAVAAVAAKVDRPVLEGSVHYKGVTPVAVMPQIGRKVDQGRAVTSVEARFESLTGNQAVIPLPVTLTPPKTSQAQIETALTQLAAPAVAGPLHLVYQGKTVDVPPATLAAVLTLAPAADGSIEATADPAKVAATFVPLIPELPTATPTNAKISLVDGKPHITPSVSALAPDPSKIAADIPAAIVSPDRTITVPAKATDPAFTTADAQKLGITQLIGSEDPNDGATPHPCCKPRVHNISLIAGIVNNALILPGQTFSLNQYVGQRTTARGFVLAPEISSGAEKQAVGGGVSQFATTMFNAAYFSGMNIIEHHPHSFWISRYPPGREATVSWPEPDLKWSNNTPYGVLVQAWDDGNHTHVRFWSTPYWQVAWSSSPETHVTQPATTYETPDELSGKQVCVATVAETGFDITIYRTLSLNGVAKPQESWFHRYIPQPLHICKINPTASPSPGASFSPGAPGSPKPGTPKPTTGPPATPTVSPKPSVTPKPSLTPTPKP